MLGEQETSSGSGVGKAETLQQAEDGFSVAEKAGKGTWVEITGLGRAGQAAPGPESEQPSRHTWEEEMTDSCKGAELTRLISQRLITSPGGWSQPGNCLQKAVSQRRAEAPTCLGSGQPAAAALCSCRGSGVAFTSVRRRAESGSVSANVEPVLALSVLL